MISYLYFILFFSHSFSRASTRTAVMYLFMPLFKETMSEGDEEYYFCTYFFRVTFLRIAEMLLRRHRVFFFGIILCYFTIGKKKMWSVMHAGKAFFSFLLLFVQLRFVRIKIINSKYKGKKRKVNLQWIV